MDPRARKRINELFENARDQARNVEELLKDAAEVALHHSTALRIQMDPVLSHVQTVREDIAKLIEGKPEPRLGSMHVADKAGDVLLARPGRSFSYRPVCHVLELRGRYRGAGTFESAPTFALAHEVLLDYRDGVTQKWHHGPAADGCSPDEKAVGLATGERV